MKPRPLFFGAEERSLAGWYHAPNGAAGRGCGVVLCDPLGLEALRAHRAYRALALQLAAAGFPVLRFDYDGTGDSCGRDEDPGRLAAWLASLDAAADQLEALAGVSELAFFGLRFGGTLATVVAAQRADVSSLVVWSPIVSGRAYVRELRAFELLRNERRPAEPGLNETAGFVRTDETEADLAGVDLLKIAPRIKAGLIFSRNDLPPDPRLEKHWREQRIEAESLDLPGYAGLMRDPHESLLPDEVVAAAVAWLGKRHPPRSAAVAPAGSLRTTAKMGEVREEVCQFGPRGDLFGVVTVGAALPPPSRPAVLMLNVGANQHVGPNRMWVLLARRLAARGFLCLRFDVSGLGESPARPGARENRIYADEFRADLQAAMAFLRSSHGCEEFELLGLCSGAYLAFHSTLADGRIKGQTLINAQTFHWKEGDSLALAVRGSYKSTRFYSRALAELDSWARAWRGEVNLRGIAGELGQRVRRRAGDALRQLTSGDAASDRVDVAAALRKVARRGAETRLIYSAEDGGLDEIERYLGRLGRKLKGRKHFAFEIIEDADHTFTARESRERLFRLIEQRLG